ncbi:MAG: DUF4394 domain-containing protein [Acidobacteria bacterium]|nr:DUF4394 domain-containing protein [Acidobacteriota bacterium]
MKSQNNLKRTLVVWLALACLIAGAVTLTRSSRAAGKTQAQDQQELDSHIQDPRGVIAFASDLEDNFEIYTVGPAGGGLEKITNNPAEDFDPSFSPDGNRIAFVSDRDGNQEIYSIGLNGGGETRLTNNAAADLDPAWSPLGTKIAFTSERDGNQNIYVMNADGTGQLRLTDNSADDFRPVWSPDGTKLAFTSMRDGNDEIYVMNADGSAQTNISNNPAQDLNPAWSPMRITFQSTRDGNDEIYSMNADGTGQTRLTNNPAFDGRPARNMEGSRVAFVSDRDGNLELYLMNADGSGQTRLTDSEANDLDPDVQPLTTTTPASAVQFSASAASVSEGAGNITLTVTRTGNTSGAAQVDFSTVNGTASDRSDYTPAIGFLEFAPGETTKSIVVPIIDDAFVETDETFSVTLGNPTGATLGAINSITVTIIDNDGGPATGTAFFGVTTSNNLVRFNANAPGTAVSTTPITGLQTGETVLGIDTRPATRQLYALGSTGRLYVITPATGRAQLASTLSVSLSGTEFGVDFNPTVDRLRVVSNTRQNLRVNVDTGATTVDASLFYPAGDPNQGVLARVGGAAYTNSVAGATTTTLYDIDAGQDILVTQNPPNNGQLNTVGKLGVDTTEVLGFDIVPGGTAYAALTTALTPTGPNASRLYTINLTTGAATFVGDLPTSGGVIRGLAVANVFVNPIDEDGFFVRQQYLDFLSREPDAAGFAFWTNELNKQIAACQPSPADARAKCVLFARANVSTAFFLSIEFQDSGYFLIRVYQEAFGRLPTIREFLEDMQDIKRGVIIGQPGAFERLATNRRDFLDRFVDRDEFRTRYAGVSNADYVNALFTNAGVNPADEAATRDALITGLNNGTESRATALVKVGDTRTVFNALYNRAFVLMEYIGYLRRDPDAPGFAFWLNKLNNASLPGEDVRDPNVALARIRRSEIVLAFVDSTEYRQRFGQP